jgi:lipoprotein NlpD
MSGKVARPLPHLAAALVYAALVAGCASGGNQAPVSERSSNTVPRPGEPVSANPATAPAASVPTYTVKPGDTLYSIAAKSGQDYRQLAAWNGIDSSYHIQVDQVLRLGPPDEKAGADVAEASPVGAGVLEQRPLGAPGALPPPSSVLPPPPSTPAPPTVQPPVQGTGDVPTKGGPLGLKRPYSDANLAELSKPDAAGDLGTTPGAPPAVPAGTPPAAAGAAASVPPAAPPTGGQTIDEASIGWIWPAKGPLLSEFDDPKNKGIDIAGKMGDPVLASGSGTVIYVGQGLRGLGNLVVVKHTEGLISVYAHNSKILVANNQPVRRGEQIAEMGNSGAEKVELHFEIRRQGAPVDPLKYLPSR